MVDEVAHGLEAERRETPGDLRGHAVEVRQRAVERAGPEEESRCGRPLGVPAAAEPQRELALRRYSGMMANAEVPGPMWVPTTAATCPWSTKCELGRMRSIISRIS